MSSPDPRGYLIRIQRELPIDYQDAGPWRSYELETYGYDYAELLDNASISAIDQDGGELYTNSFDAVETEIQDAVERIIKQELERV